MKRKKRIGKEGFPIEDRKKVKIKKEIGMCIDVKAENLHRCFQ